MQQITLRSYQQQIIDGIYHHWSNGLKRLIVFAATRSGKTIVFTWMAIQTISKGNNVLILTNRKKLFDQTGNTLIDFGLKPYFVTAKTKSPNYNFKCTVVMSQTLNNRIKNTEWREWLEKTKPLIVIDEAHLCDVTSILQDDIVKDFFVLGFTGSPRRSGNQREFHDDGFQQIVIGSYTCELEPKYCIPAEVYEVPIDMSGVAKKSDGDFNNYETFKKFDSPKKYKGAVNNWEKYAKNKVTLGYCVSIIHAAKTCLEFIEHGIDARFIASKKAKPKKPKNTNPGAWTKYRIAIEEYDFLQENSHLTGDTTEVIQSWEKGDFPILFNIDILTFGYDNNKIDCVLINFATLSLPKWLQSVNRGGTPREGKEKFIVLDLGGNSERLQDYNYRHEWALFHKKPDGGGVPTSKECPKCHSLLLGSSRVCDFCGFEFPKTEEGKLVELVKRKYSAAAPREIDFSKMSFKEIEEYAKRKGYKKAWVWRQIYVSFGEDELKTYSKNKGYHWAWYKRIIKRYK